MINFESEFGYLEAIGFMLNILWMIFLAETRSKKIEKIRKCSNQNPNPVPKTETGNDYILDSNESCIAEISP